MLRSGLLNFSKGVLSERLLGRVDVAAYNAGLKQGENIVVLKQGAFSIRPGFRMISEALHTDEKLVSFQFSLEQPYALAFGDLTLQPLSKGGVVLEEELVIIGITNTDPMVVNAAYHGFVAGDQVYIQGQAGALGDALNDQVFEVVASLDPSHFSIAINGVGLPAFTASTGGITRVAPPDPPPAVPATPDPYVPPEEPQLYGGGHKFDEFYVGISF